MKKKVLVIDDNENNLLLEKDLLEVAGFEVFEAEDASLGIALAKKEKPAIIIMDVVLPDMNGIEAAKMLRNDKETIDIPIVFVTASVMKKDVKSLNNVFHTGFISKPINTRTFVTEISQYLSPHF
jgi:CheY-like chemotaxis protein